jgi:hypothetical protein
LALAKACSDIFNNPGEPASKVYLDVSFDNVGLEGTEKFILQSSGEILDKDSFIVFNPCALKPGSPGLLNISLHAFANANKGKDVKLSIDDKKLTIGRGDKGDENLSGVIEINRLCFINPLKSSSILSTFSTPSAIVSFKRDAMIVRLSVNV